MFIKLTEVHPDGEPRKDRAWIYINPEKINYIFRDYSGESPNGITAIYFDNGERINIQEYPAQIIPLGWETR